MVDKALRKDGLKKKNALLVDNIEKKSVLKAIKKFDFEYGGKLPKGGRLP